MAELRHSPRSPPAQPSERASGAVDDPALALSPADYFVALCGVEPDAAGYVHCPLPDHDERTASCRVYADHWWCFGCERGGGIYDLASLLQSGPWGPELRADDVIETIRRLLDRGADPNEVHHNEFGAMSVLYGAAGVAHNPDATRLLLERGADPNDGESVYHACEADDTTCLQILLDAGTTVRGTNALNRPELPAGPARLSLSVRPHAQEVGEVFVVLRGSGRLKLDDEIVELQEWDAVRVPPGSAIRRCSRRRAYGRRTGAVPGAIGLLGVRGASR